MLRPFLTTTGLVASLLVAVGCDGDEKTEPSCPDTPGVICTWAGDGVAAFDGDGNPLLASSFYWPVDLTFAPDGETYIVDWNNHRVRRVTAEQTLETVIGTDFIGDGPDDLSDQTAPGALGTTIHLNHPTQVLPLPDGKLIAVSWHNHKLRTYDPSTRRAVVSCGGPVGFGGDGGTARAARLNQPISIDRAPDGTLFLLDQRNQVIRQIAADGMISTIVGTPTESGFAGDGGDPLTAKMAQPTGSNPPPGGSLVLDSEGRIYFSDVLNHRVRRVDLAANVIETVAGTGEAGFGGDGGPAIEAKLNNPRKLTFGPDGRLYIGDEKNHRIRALDVETGVITTVLGTGVAGYAGDGGEATEAQINRPTGVSFNGDHMYVMDTYNHVIRRVRLGAE